MVLNVAFAASCRLLDASPRVIPLSPSRSQAARLEGWGDTKLVHRMNHAHDIVSEHLQQQFVDLRDGCSAPHEIPKLPFHRGERGLNVAALVVCLQKISVRFKA